MILPLFSSFIRKYSKYLIIYVIILCFLTAERVAIPHFYGKLLDSIKSAHFSKTFRIFAIVVSIFLAFQILDTILTYIDANIMPQFEAHIRKHVVNTIIDRYQQQYTELNLGNITSKLIKLPGYLNFLFFKMKTFLFSHVLSILITAGYLFYCHVYLGAIFSGSFVILGILTWAFCTHCNKASYTREATFDRTQEDIQDILYNLQTVYVNRTETQERDRMNTINNEIIRRTREATYCGIPFRIMFAVLFLVVFVSITWTSIDLYRHKKLSLALLVSSFMVTFSILRTCISFYFDFDTFIFLYGGIKVVSDYLNSLPKATKVARTRAAPNLFHSGGIDISIENIVYKPPLPNLKGDSPIQSDPSRPLFDGLTMHIRKGEHVAITGRIGSGKSTLAYLLLKMQHISGGSIKLDGININDIDASSVRKAIHYIPQNPRLFNRTLWDNISYGNPSLQPNQVYSMLRELNMLRLESLFRNKMYEYVGKHGYKLSGGQRQMVFLIRLLFNTDAKVLILDEPTSALDQESRDQILRLIKVASRNRTLIVITHDPEILKHTHTTFNIIDGQAVTN